MINLSFPLSSLRKYPKHILALFIALLISLAPLIGIFASPKVAMAYSSISTPSNVTVEQDDRLAIVSWGNASDQYDFPYNPDFGNGIRGYYVSWGPVANGFTNNSSSYYRAFEMQPLINGTQYQVRIQAVDENGDLSAPSTTTTFTGDATRVNSLKSQMNGFYDDFNTSAGAFDEKKWNNAYSGCVIPGSGGQFVNNQFHSHNQLQTIDTGVGCDRGQNISRPRPYLDFTGRTGLITFDLDGALRRDQWYMDLNDSSLGPLDISGHVDLEVLGDSSKNSNPAHTLRIHQNGNTVKIFTFDANGVEQQTSDWNGSTICKDLRFCTKNLEVINNVRRHWQIQVSKTRATVTIDGIVVADSNLNDSFHVGGLPYEKASMMWTAFSYNTGKSNEPSTLMHWDNFGFDAPNGFTPTNVTHNYNDGVIGTTNTSTFQSTGGQPYPMSSLTTPYTDVVKIPDSILTPLGARLHFTIQNSASFGYTWTNNDRVIINGHTYNVPQPSIILGTGSHVGSRVYPYPFILTGINPADLVQGDNAVKFYISDEGIFNVHIELDYAVANEPAYTSPATTYPNYNFMNMAANVGPGSTISHIGATSINITGTRAQNASSLGTISGVATIEAQITDEIAMIATGKNLGIRNYQLLVDRNVVQNYFTNNTIAATFIDKTLNFDTTTLCNGDHEFFVRAYNPSGDASIPDFFQGHSKQGDYYPLIMTTSNNGNVACPNGNGYSSIVEPDPFTNTGVSPTPTPTIMPTPTMVMNTPTPTPTPAPTSTVNPTLPVGTPTPTGFVTVMPTVTATINTTTTPTPNSTIGPTISPTINITPSNNGNTPSMQFTPSPSNIMNMTTSPIISPSPTPGLLIGNQIDLSLGEGQVSRTSKPIITGHNIKDARIDVHSALQTYPVKPDSGGNWSVQIQSTLTDGLHTVDAYDINGNHIENVSFTVITSLPSTGILDSTASMVPFGISLMIVGFTVGDLIKKNKYR